MINNVDYHIIDKCNLNCASCNHFSPLFTGDNRGKSINQITADLNLLSKVSDGFEVLTLLGGEPTLHPQLSNILGIARSIFPKKEIHLVTNGTKYDKFDRWKDALMSNNIVVYVSLYPYCSDYMERLQKIKQTLEPEVRIEYVDYPTDCGFNYGFLTNRDDIVTNEELKYCERPFNCCQLKNGKLYLCNFAAQFDVLKRFFSDKITFDLDGKECFDLNGNVTLKDLESFIVYANPNICRHCLDIHNGGTNAPTRKWAITKKDIEEWVID